MKLDIKTLVTDSFTTGSGVVGCYAALIFYEESGGRMLVAERANIRRSDRLATGVSVINTYVVPGKMSQDCVDYARADAGGIVRGDSLLIMAESLNRTAAKLESSSLTILKDAWGQYMVRGSCNIKINGENIKPVLANAVVKQSRITVLDRVNVSDYIVRDGRILGAYATGMDEPVLYVISVKAVLCATDDATGLCRPSHLGFSHHEMQYPSFNMDVGYATGIRTGAEMTTFEMRFIILHCKDTIAPTGMLTRGVGAEQISSLGEAYEQKYGTTTSRRVHGMATENLKGCGPCYLRTVGITRGQDEELQRAYLNMAPSQTLRWMESGYPPSVQNAEIKGTEPYIVDGHTVSGYWVDIYRETTIKGLFAAGDVTGGCPQKCVIGVLVEGEIAARAVVKYQQDAILLSAPGVMRVRQ